MGLFEAATGLGVLCGPIIGAALYSMGGFILPFYGLSMVYFLNLPLIVYVARIIEEAESAKESLAASKKNDKLMHKHDD